MKLVLVEELMNYKVLPFALYNEDGILLLEAGEKLTPGKLLQLKHLDIIFKKKTVEEKIEVSTEIEETEIEEPEIISENFDLFYTTPPVTATSSLDEVDIEHYKGPLNRKAKININTQIRVKSVHIKAIRAFQEGKFQDSIQMMIDIKNKLQSEVEVISNEVSFASQLLFIGEYSNCHPLNTAVLVAALAKKMGYTEEVTSDLILSALIHDIGKIDTTKAGIIIPEKYTEHTERGYYLSKNIFHLSDSISLIILCHHKNKDYNNYTKNLLNSNLSIYADIVNICSSFDNLIFNRTPNIIKNTHDAYRVMLSWGTNMFLPEVFYSFIHLFNYNDTTPLEEMTVE